MPPSRCQWNCILPGPRNSPSRLTDPIYLHCSQCLVWRGQSKSPQYFIIVRAGTIYRYNDALGYWLCWYAYRYAWCRIAILSEIRLTANLINYLPQNKFWYNLFFRFCCLPDQKSKEAQIIVRWKFYEAILGQLYKNCLLSLDRHRKKFPW